MILWLMVLFTHNLLAQNIVTGIVRDEAGQPMPGVNVVAKGTASGAVTDVNGKFSLQVQPNATLVFTFVGMMTQEVQVKNQTNLNVTMASGTVGVGEVVVTALGISREKKILA